MTTEEALRIIYESQGFVLHPPISGIDHFWIVENKSWPSTFRALCETWQDVLQYTGNPLSDTAEGLAEFARLVLWSVTEFQEIKLCLGIKEYWAEFPIRTNYVGFSASLQEAFIMALASALQAREKGGE